MEEGPAALQHLQRAASPGLPMHGEAPAQQLHEPQTAVTTATATTMAVATTAVDSALQEEDPTRQVPEPTQEVEDVKFQTTKRQ